MAPMHNRCCISITIHGNDAFYMHLQMFVVYLQNTAHATVKPEVDQSSQVQFDLTQAQTMAYLQAFAMVWDCLLKFPS